MSNIAWRKVVMVIWWIYIPSTIIGTTVLALLGAELLAKIYCLIGMSVNFAGFVILKTVGRLRG
jgi:hypothetical protein